MACPQCDHKSVIFEGQEHTDNLAVFRYRCGACGHVFTRTGIPVYDTHVKEGEEISFRTGYEVDFKG